MNKHYDVLIVGGGIIGLTTALGLASQQCRIGILDSGSFTADVPALDPRVYAINKASQSLFEQLKVWPRIDADRISPYQHMHVWDSANLAYIDFDARDIAAAELGVILEESVIKQALLQRVQEEKTITLFPASRVIHIDVKEGVTIKSQAETWRARLLIAADGAESVTRRLLKVPIHSWPYHQAAIVASVRTEKPHQQTAYQVFNPDGPLAFLPYKEPHQCSIVWSTLTAHAKSMAALDKASFEGALAKAFAYKLGAVKLTSPTYQFPLMMRHTKQYAGKNWLLIGDAAHTVHPLAGLGLNIGLADVSALMSLLDVNALSHSKALGHYQRQRKTALWQMIGLMGGLKTLFANPLPPVVSLRGLGVTLCNRLTPVKRFLISEAAGRAWRG